MLVIFGAHHEFLVNVFLFDARISFSSFLALDTTSRNGTCLEFVKGEMEVQVEDRCDRDSCIPCIYIRIHFDILTTTLKR